METSAKPSNSHIGRKISRIRELRGIKQETLASELGVSQQTVSRMEQSETIEDAVLEKIAGILGVTSEAIKNFSEEAVIYNIQNNYEGSNNHGANVGHQFNFNPIEKIVELYDEKVALLERLLQAEKEKNELIQNSNKK
ncbi:helix-turn-helix domain-containing protein [Mucilaginibacter jinjuensis]|uniref:Helix-turn-helix transcriptional regulator n=1 Tax=Mucilaginibacter jinjuensis TaxID=1176721 RepID=A0ABY7TAN7_9SPHI|nr:helix-turn-helix transcriptional regulator [Mucilaginibacter jinjuensis]WCT13501.1 helix-turn-helix transcriptional regulator [Mucilaginibacter jinjuensis]